MGISNEIECEPVLITKTDDSDIELLVVEINIKGNPVRLFTGYGPQENVSEDKVMEFYRKFDEEIVSAQNSGCDIIIELDFRLT